MNLKGEETLELGLATLTQTRIPDPSLSAGTIEATGFGKDGNIYLLQREDVEVIRDEENGTAHYILDGKKVPLDFELTADGSMTTILCTVYRREKSTWVQHVRGHDTFSFEGNSPPFCESFNKAPELVPFLDPADSASADVGSSEVPKEQKKPILDTLAPKNDDAHWGILSVGNAEIAARITWLEGEFKNTPALFWKKGKNATDGNWIPLKGLEDLGPLAIRDIKAGILACTTDFAGVYDQVSGALIWSTQEACPTKWPDEAR